MTDEAIPTKPLAPREPRRRPVLALEVLDGPDKGRRFSGLSTRCSIGSHASNTVVLGDPTVSRFHCELAIDGDLVRVIDRSSLNGTRVDQVDVERAIVHH